MLPQLQEQVEVVVIGVLEEQEVVEQADNHQDRQ
jgi:hypothetical protein